LLIALNAVRIEKVRRFRAKLIYVINNLSVSSIEQNTPADSLPDFRNLGVALRILLIGNAAGFAAALIQASDLQQFAAQFAADAVVLEPVLLASLATLYALSTWLARRRYTAGILLVLLLVTVWTLLACELAADIAGATTLFGRIRAAVLALLLASWLIAYFHWRRRAHSPALVDARLQALQARIRPHFLFNSINAVLSLIRSEPKRAESALEDLAELFRTLMQDNRQLTTLAQELELCRQYLNLEQLRLGARLQVEWNIANMPADAVAPQLLLQPLLENAIYHGIEPGLEPGTVRIGIRRDKNEVLLTLSNPYHPEHQHRAGNRMALANIRERLALHFDVEARLDTRVAGDRFEIRMAIPYRSHA